MHKKKLFIIIFLILMLAPVINIQNNVMAQPTIQEDVEPWKTPSAFILHMAQHDQYPTIALRNVAEKFSNNGDKDAISNCIEESQKNAALQIQIATTKSFTTHVPLALACVNTGDKKLALTTLKEAVFEATKIQDLYYRAQTLSEVGMQYHWASQDDSIAIEILMRAVQVALTVKKRRL